MCSTDVDYDSLDPGIREVVRWVNDHGFATCDSGDGVTKLSDPAWDPDCINDVPHVVITVEPVRLVSQARRLLAALRAAGVPVDRLTPDGSGVGIQASYDPVDGTAAIILSGLDDAGLAAAGKGAEVVRAAGGAP